MPSFKRKSRKAPDSPEPRPYNRDDYEVGDQLGRGAAGAVFRMTSEHGPDLALKRGGTAEMESGILDRLGEHDNIIHKVDSGEDELIMELMAEGDAGKVQQKLKAALDDSRISWPEYIGALQHIHGGALRGLEHMESSGLVHGDVKPSNMGLGQDLNTRLFDFDATVEHGEQKPHWTMGYSFPEAQASSEGDVMSVGQMASREILGQGSLGGFRKEPEVRTAVHDFIEPTANRELSPGQALQKDYIHDALLDGDGARDVLRRVLQGGDEDEVQAAPREVVPSRDDDTRKWDKKAHKAHKKALRKRSKQTSRKQRKRHGSLLDEIRGFDKDDLNHVEANSDGAMAQLSETERGRMLHPESHWSLDEDGEAQRRHRTSTGRTKKARRGDLEGWWSNH